MEVDDPRSTVMYALAVILIFDLFIRKPNQYVSWHMYTCDLILVKLAPVVMSQRYYI